MSVIGKVNEAMSYMDALKSLLSVGEDNDLDALCRFNGKHEEISDLCGRIDRCLKDAKVILRKRGAI